VKAAIVTRYGAPEVLEIRDVPARCRATTRFSFACTRPSVCYGDRIIRQVRSLVRLMGGLRRPKAAILGCDLSGTVVSAART
jgi:NADPH:quinone reductase-like Zn-dependent oxidoreductase